MRKSFIRVLDALAAWLDRQIVRDMKRNMSPPPKTAPGRADAPRLPDGHFANPYGPCIVPDLSKATYDIRLVRLTPDRYTDPYLEGVRKQVAQIAGADVATWAPEGS
jgi:hypothetical protein